MVWKPREVDVVLWATLRGLQIGILLAPQTGMAIIWVSSPAEMGGYLEAITHAHRFSAFNNARAFLPGHGLLRLSLFE